MHPGLDEEVRDMRPIELLVRLRKDSGEVPASSQDPPVRKSNPLVGVTLRELRVVREGPVVLTLEVWRE